MAPLRCTQSVPAAVRLELGDVVGDVVDLTRAVGGLRRPAPGRPPRARGGPSPGGSPRRSWRRPPSRRGRRRPSGEEMRRAGELAVGKRGSRALRSPRPSRARSRCRPGGPSPREPVWMSTVSLPCARPKAAAASGSTISLDPLDLDEVVAGADRAELRPRRAARALGHGRRVGAGQAAAGLGVLEVVLGPDAELGRARAGRRTARRSSSAPRERGARRRCRRRTGSRARSRARAARRRAPSSLASSGSASSRTPQLMS